MRRDVNGSRPKPEQAQAFPAARRIRKRREFQAVYARGKKFHTTHYLLFVHWLPGQPQRVGIAASRKIGNAVARNRVKRVLREFFRTARLCFPGAQFVAVAKKDAPALGLTDASQELEPVLARLAGN